MKKAGKLERAKVQKIAVFYIFVFMCCLLAGCDSLRFAPGEAQKKNAWLHNRTTMMAAQTAETEAASQKLQALTQLSEVQSRAFSGYYGLPEEFPQAETIEDVLNESNWQLARTALSESTERPSGWEVADSMLELGIGICALLGGVYGTRAVGFLRKAKTKSKALQEIIAGNEHFKKQNASSASAFKQAHQNQSSQTRQIVTEIKVNS